MTKDRFQDPFQSETLPAGRDREGRLLDLSYPAKKRQREASLARHDADRRHHQWLSFQAALEPDGQKSHWLKVDRKLSKAASADAGDIVTLEIAPAAKDTEPEVPTDLKKALAAAAPKTRTVWSDITPNARRDWIHWITSAKQEETRARRIKNACSMLASGKRRVCCFDRSGFYSKSMSAPKAAI